MCGTAVQSLSLSEMQSSERPSVTSHSRSPLGNRGRTPRNNWPRKGEAFSGTVRCRRCKTTALQHPLGTLPDLSLIQKGALLRPLRPFALSSHQELLGNPYARSNVCLVCCCLRRYRLKSLVVSEPRHSFR